MTRWTANLGTGRPATPVRFPDPDLLPAPVAALVHEYHTQVEISREGGREAQALLASRNQVIDDYRKAAAAANVAGKPRPPDPIPDLDAQIREAEDRHGIGFEAGELLLTKIGQTVGAHAAKEAARAVTNRQKAAAKTVRHLETAIAAAADLAIADALEGWWGDIAAHPERPPSWSETSGLTNRIIGYASTALSVAAEAAKPDDQPRTPDELILADDRAEDLAAATSETGDE